CERVAEEQTSTFGVVGKDDCVNAGDHGRPEPTGCLRRRHPRSAPGFRRALGAATRLGALAASGRSECRSRTARRTCGAALRRMRLRQCPHRWEEVPMTVSPAAALLEIAGRRPAGATAVAAANVAYEADRANGARRDRLTLASSTVVRAPQNCE